MCHPYIIRGSSMLALRGTPLFRGTASLLGSNISMQRIDSSHAVLDSTRTFYGARWQKTKYYNAIPRKRKSRALTIPTFSKENALDPFVARTHPTFSTKRAGVIATKIGCMSLWDEWGERHPITVCKVDKNIILNQRTIQKDGYTAVQIAAGTRSIYHHNKRQLGEFIKRRIPPKAVVKEIKCSPDALLPEGHEISVRHFTPGQWCFVSGFSKGRGFKSVIQRWGFGGAMHSHGRKSKERLPGSIGQGQTVHTVWKFKKMGGHLGPDPRVVNCKVFRYESTRGLLFLKGQVPGHKGSYIKVSDARGVTSILNNDLEIPYPTFIPEEGKKYPVTVQCPPKLRDPFLFPDIAIDEE